MTGSDNGESRTQRPLSITPTASLIDRYARGGSDYGIYPPRRRFSSAFTADDYRQHALAGNQLPLPDPLTLCFRIPAAAELQTAGAPSASREKLERYFDRVHCELALQGLLFDSDRVVEEMHIGAAGATGLKPSHLASLMTHIGRHFTIQHATHREFSLFARAVSDEPEAIAALVELGINRLQLGPVALDKPASRRSAALSFEAAAVLIDAARRAGVRSVGADLCYGLPGQTGDQFERAVARILVLRPDRIAIRDAQLQETGQGTAGSGDASGLPGPAARFDMALVALGLLGEAGYRHLGQGHFALSGDDLMVAKDNARLQYTTRGYAGHGRCDSIGLGAATISHVHNCYAENVSSAEAYVSQLAERRLPVAGGLEFSEDDRIRANVIQAILCQDRLAYKDVERQFSIEFESYFAAEMVALAALERDGLLEIRAGELTLTSAGDLMRSRIARELDLFSV